jgi:GTP cyclohydrolase IA
MRERYFGAGDKVLPGEQLVIDAIKVLLEHIGEDPERNGLKDTPKRVAKAWLEMTDGYKQDPKEILATVFDDEYDEIVVVRDIPFCSNCEHHLLPFVGSVDIGYLPNKGIVGLSKLARLVDCFSKRLQVQERMTRQIADAIEEHLQAKGVGVIVRSSHQCMSCRGVKKPGVTMVTSAMLGIFREEAAARHEFLELCK